MTQDFCESNDEMTSSTRVANHSVDHVLDSVSSNTSVEDAIQSRDGVRVAALQTIDGVVADHHWRWPRLEARAGSGGCHALEHGIAEQHDCWIVDVAVVVEQGKVSVLRRLEGSLLVLCAFSEAVRQIAKNKWCGELVHRVLVPC